MGKRKTIFLPSNRSAIIVTKVANQSIPNITVTKVLLDTLIFNSNDYVFRVATNDIQIIVNGFYQISYVNQWAAGIIGSRSCQIFKNAALLTSDANPVATIAAALPHKFSSFVAQLIMGDIIDMRVYHNQGAALVLNAVAGIAPMLSISLIEVN